MWFVGFSSEPLLRVVGGTMAAEELDERSRFLSNYDRARVVGSNLLSSSSSPFLSPLDVDMGYLMMNVRSAGVGGGKRVRHHRRTSHGHHQRGGVRDGKLQLNSNSNETLDPPQNLNRKFRDGQSDIDSADNSMILGWGGRGYFSSPMLPRVSSRGRGDSSSSSSSSSRRGDGIKQIEESSSDAHHALPPHHHHHYHHHHQKQNENQNQQQYPLHQDHYSQRMSEVEVKEQRQSQADRSLVVTPVTFQTARNRGSRRNLVKHSSQKRTGTTSSFSASSSSFPTAKKHDHRVAVSIVERKAASAFGNDRPKYDAHPRWRSGEGNSHLKRRQRMLHITNQQRERTSSHKFPKSASALTARAQQAALASYKRRNLYDSSKLMLDGSSLHAEEVFPRERYHSSSWEGGERRGEKERGPYTDLMMMMPGPVWGNDMNLVTEATPMRPRKSLWKQKKTYVPSPPESYMEGRWNKEANTFKLGYASVMADRSTYAYSPERLSRGHLHRQGAAEETGIRDLQPSVSPTATGNHASPLQPLNGGKDDRDGGPTRGRENAAPLLHVRSSSLPSVIETELGYDHVGELVHPPLSSAKECKRVRKEIKKATQEWKRNQELRMIGSSSASSQKEGAEDEREEEEEEEEEEEPCVPSVEPSRAKWLVWDDGGGNGR